MACAPRIASKKKWGNEKKIGTHRSGKEERKGFRRCGGLRLRRCRGTSGNYSGRVKRFDSHKRKDRPRRSKDLRSGSSDGTHIKAACDSPKDEERKRGLIFALGRKYSGNSNLWKTKIGCHWKAESSQTNRKVKKRGLGLNGGSPKILFANTRYLRSGSLNGMVPPRIKKTCSPERPKNKNNFKWP